MDKRTREFAKTVYMVSIDIVKYIPLQIYENVQFKPFLGVIRRFKPYAVNHI